jgi:hypothetical protein
MMRRYFAFDKAVRLCTFTLINITPISHQSGTFDSSGEIAGRGGWSHPQQINNATVSLSLECHLVTPHPLQELPHAHFEVLPVAQPCFPMHVYRQV